MHASSSPALALPRPSSDPRSHRPLRCRLHLPCPARQVVVVDAEQARQSTGTILEEHNISSSMSKARVGGMSERKRCHGKQLGLPHGVHADAASLRFPPSRSTTATGLFASRPQDIQEKVEALAKEAAAAAEGAAVPPPTPEKAHAA